MLSIGIKQHPVWATKRQRHHSIDKRRKNDLWKLWVKSEQQISRCWPRAGGIKAEKLKISAIKWNFKLLT